MYRVELLDSFGCDPYVMPYDKEDSYQKKFARWVNHKALFKSTAWEDYQRSRSKKETDVDQIEFVYG